MADIDRLIEADRKKPLAVAVIGDALRDIWIEGEPAACQEGCPRFLEKEHTITPGGAANAARQLANWQSEAVLIAPMDDRIALLCDFDYDWCPFTKSIPTKTRFLDADGHILFRADHDTSVYHPGNALHLRNIMPRRVFQGILLADYNKGFLDEVMIHEQIRYAAGLAIPCVADPRRPPEAYQGALLKCDKAYFDRHPRWFKERQDYQLVVTRGRESPLVYNRAGHVVHVVEARSPVMVKNIIGAGDCYAAHLLLALAHGMNLEDAAQVAYSAGRVYVQHAHARPPWPHEIKKDLHPVRGKILNSRDLPALRKSAPGRMIFTNGIFRIPHVGHTWLLDWARQQGDVLVVAVNDDASAAQLKPGKVILPLEERLEHLAALECVDWVVPYPEPLPNATIDALKPDILVKGHDYAGQYVPGCQLVKDTLFAPESPYPTHASQLVQLCQEEG